MMQIILNPWTPNMQKWTSPTFNMDQSIWNFGDIRIKMLTEAFIHIGIDQTARIYTLKCLSEIASSTFNS